MAWKTLAAVALGFGLLGTAGCGGDKKDAGPPKGGENKKEGDHGEHGAGPHKGTVFDFGGGKYHGEFVVDHKTKEATVYLLGADEKTPAPVRADKLRLVVTNTTPKVEIDLLPTDAKDGSASAFTGRHEGFGKVMEYKGTVRFNVGDTQYSGDFEEKPEKK